MKVGPDTDEGWPVIERADSARQWRTGSDTALLLALLAAKCCAVCDVSSMT